MKEPSPAIIDSKGNSKFPSHFLPPNEKRSEKWCLAYVKAFHEEAAYRPTDMSLSRNNQNYTRMRRYARGEQSENQYKELLGLKKNKGNHNTSFRNLNFEILKVAPKLRNVLVNKVVNNPYKINVKPVDRASFNQRQSEKSKMLAYVVSQEQIAHFEKLSKLGLEKPIAPGEIPPSSVKDVEPWLDMNPKSMVAMETKDFLSYNLNFNDWKQISREVTGDLVDIGIGGTLQELDVDGYIRIKRILIERAISNRCIFPDFRDLIRFGQYEEVTVSDLKRLTKGKWGEENYRKIANTIAGTDGATNRFMGAAVNYYDSTTYTYAYDHEKVTILKALWYSTDNEVEVQYYNNAGNSRMKTMEHNYVPFKGDKTVNEGRGMSDEQFNEVNKGKKQIFRRIIKNVYKCTWVVGTDYVYNHGLLENMLKSINHLGEVQMPVTLYSTDFISTMSLIEQSLDAIQLDWLQYQSHRNASKPPGIAIERNALAKLGTKGKAGKKWDPREALIMYAEIGSLIYDGTDQHGNPLSQKPFEELQNGMSEAAQGHFNFILQHIDMIRNILGLNIMTEGQTPPERMANGVAQMAWGASDNALSHLNDAFRSIYERTCKNVVLLLQSTVGVSGPPMADALGTESKQFWSLNSELGLRELGVIIEEGPDQVLRDKISGHVNAAVAKGELLPEQAIQIELEDNPYRAIQMITKARMERENELHTREKEKIAIQAQEQAKGQQELEKIKAQYEADRQQRERSNKLLEGEIQRQNQAQLFVQGINMKRVEQKNELEQSDKDFIEDMALLVRKGVQDIEKEKAKPKPKPATKN